MTRLFLEIKNITLCAEPSFFILLYFLWKNLLFLCNEPLPFGLMTGGHSCPLMHFPFLRLIEYIQGCIQTGSKSSEEVLTKAFQLFDVNHDEFMDQKEFYCAMNYLSATE
jgi:hypothetical protein